MGLLECCRLILYLVEWIWTTVILGVFPSQLVQDVQLANGEMAKACLFNLTVGLSRCSYAVAWAAIAFVVLTCTILWYSLEYCSSIQLPGNVETVIFSWLTIWWFVGAVTLTATKADGAPNAATVSVVFAWMLFIFSAISAFVGNRGPKQIQYRVSETDGDSEYD